MSTKELKDLLERIEDTREIVLGPAKGKQRATGEVAEVYAVWDAARRDARSAYDAWRAKPSRDAYAVYRAAADRADAAALALAQAAKPVCYDGPEARRRHRERRPEGGAR